LDVTEIQIATNLDDTSQFIKGGLRGNLDRFLDDAKLIGRKPRAPTFYRPPNILIRSSVARLPAESSSG